MEETTRLLVYGAGLLGQAFKALLLACLLGFATAGVSAAPSAVGTAAPRRELTPQAAYQQLLEVRFFAFGGVGIAGVPSEGELACRALLRSTNAVGLFTAALTNGNPATELYALCGLRKVAPEKFEPAASQLAKTNAEVLTMTGCILGREPVPKVVNRIRKGDYDRYLTPPKS